MWKFIKCPKCDHPITWDKCLACGNLECHESCPPLEYRRLVYEDLRKYELGVYHVTELSHLRYSYYNRQLDYTAGWDNTIDLHVGKAFHEHIQRQFEPWVEIPVWHDYGAFKIVGSIDAYDVTNQMIIDFKVYSSLKYLLERGPHEDHVFQVRAYYTLALQLILYPEDLTGSSGTWKAAVFKVFPPKRLCLWYFAKRKGNPDTRCRRFLIEPMILPDLYKRAEELHLALLTSKPPSRLTCPDWLCRFCPFWETCLGTDPRGMWDSEIHELKKKLEGVCR